MQAKQVKADHNKAYKIDKHKSISQKTCDKRERCECDLCELRFNCRDLYPRYLGPDPELDKFII